MATIDRRPPTCAAKVFITQPGNGWNSIHESSSWVLFFPLNRLSNAATAPIHGDVIVAVGRALCPLVLFHRSCLVLDPEPNADGCDGEEDEAWVAGAVFGGEDGLVLCFRVLEGELGVVGVRT